MCRCATKNDAVTGMPSGPHYAGRIHHGKPSHDTHSAGGVTSRASTSMGRVPLHRRRITQSRHEANKCPALVDARVDPHVDVRSRETKCPSPKSRSIRTLCTSLGWT